MEDLKVKLTIDLAKKVALVNLNDNPELAELMLAGKAGFSIGVVSSGRIDLSLLSYKYSQAGYVLTYSLGTVELDLDDEPENMVALEYHDGSFVVSDSRKLSPDSKEFTFNLGAP